METLPFNGIYFNTRKKTSTTTVEIKYKSGVSGLSHSKQTLHFMCFMSLDVQYIVWDEMTMRTILRPSVLDENWTFVGLVDLNKKSLF